MRPSRDAALLLSFWLGMVSTFCWICGVWLSDRSTFHKATPSQAMEHGAVNALLPTILIADAQFCLAGEKFSAFIDKMETPGISEEVLQGRMLLLWVARLMLKMCQRHLMKFRSVQLVFISLFFESISLELICFWTMIIPSAISFFLSSCFLCWYFIVWMGESRDRPEWILWSVSSSALVLHRRIGSRTPTRQELSILLWHITKLEGWLPPQKMYFRCFVPPCRGAGHVSLLHLTQTFFLLQFRVNMCQIFDNKSIFPDVLATWISTTQHAFHPQPLTWSTHQLLCLLCISPWINWKLFIGSSQISSSVSWRPAKQFPMH